MKPPQLLEILDINLESQNQLHQLIRKINLTQWLIDMKLSSETGDNVFSNVDIDTKCNSFLIIYLRYIFFNISL